jgi:protein ImuB
MSIMDFSEKRATTNMRRILAVWLPRLPTDRIFRRAKGAPQTIAAPSAFKAPLLISQRINNTLSIHALDVRAERLGLYKGQPMANAQAMVRELCVLPADEKSDAALLESIADWCDRFSPFVACDGKDGLLLDVTGATHLFGGEAAMLELVKKRIAAQGFSVRAALAGTAPAAQALARFADGHIAAPGMEAQALARLPVAALPCDDIIRRALDRAGLKTIAQVASRQRSELAARFGKPFVAGLDVLLGAQDKPIAPRRPLPDLMAEQRFAEPIVTAAAISASLSGLAQSLKTVLEQRGLGLRALEAAFFRADGQVRRIAVRLGAPVRDEAILLRLLNEKLESLADPLDAGFGFDLIRLETRLAEETGHQTASLDGDENAQWQLRFLVDRLSARFGDHRVLRFVPQDTHIPEAAAVAVPAQDSDFGQERWMRKREENDPPRRPLRLLQKPEPIKGSFASVPDGAPAFFQWRQCRHEVVRAEGPERIAMEWWKRSAGESPSKQNKEQPGRDYFRVETRQGQRFWIYRDGRHDGLATRWYLQGIFA